MRPSAHATWWSPCGGGRRPWRSARPCSAGTVYGYVAQGAMAARGWDVYADGPSRLPGPLTAGVDRLWRDTPAPYGPVFVWLAAHVVRVTGEHVLPGVMGMRMLAVGGFALVAWAVRRLAVMAEVCKSNALWLAVLNPLTPVHLVGGAHNDAVMLGLMASGLVIARRGWLALWGRRDHAGPARQSAGRPRAALPDLRAERRPHRAAPPGGRRRYATPRCDAPTSWALTGT
ncbi:polyprenol phosphomannose-dependent alpha 1,6 mannosyltransferase MptB [Actinacidiphila sp. ITFR-21]|uniref:polyprenol phosphomannose-dependent alpha 1,6 mannosyltransferase MptB n=1 Tax=Actinacidiphila sp. ITFR-21 TaxID=3075199 RepID=UPI00288A0B1B|nr:polyprenol phosphomannose-dependent alpha 1,6 mannosyltransferase MptB [Streptomyces sp. ITFR-21]WNI19685.1 polyprenol phosphomannose-dependent alpha 1,6 mannosyltransferase MptB [Streptomyces sp. ITFR-21]